MKKHPKNKKDSFKKRPVKKVDDFFKREIDNTSILEIIKKMIKKENTMPLNLADILTITDKAKRITSIEGNKDKISRELKNNIIGAMIYAEIPTKLPMNDFSPIIEKIIEDVGKDINTLMSFKINKRLDEPYFNIVLVHSN